MFDSLPRRILLDFLRVSNPGLLLLSCELERAKLELFFERCRKLLLFKCEAESSRNMTELADYCDPESCPSFGSFDVSKKFKFLELCIELEFIPSS